MSFPCLIELKNVSVRLEGRSVLNDINWRLHRGENWVVTGPNGSGKSVFMRLLAGKLWPDPHSKPPGKRIYGFGSPVSESPVGLESDLVWLAPEQQRRYRQSDWNMTCEDVVLSGLKGEDLLYRAPTREERDRARVLLDRLHMSDLGPLPFQHLSQGELRKVLIARALMAEPRVVLLDEFYDGLDGENRSQISGFLERLVNTFSLQAVITGHRAEDVPSWITHSLVLDKGRSIRQSEYSGSFPEPRFSIPSNDCPPGPGRRIIPHLQERSEKREVQKVLQLENCDLYRGEKRVLCAFNWTVHRGENWVVRGKNGSGKSSLLQLIQGELSCALGGTIKRFELSDESGGLRFAKKNMGLVSSKLQARMDPGQSVFEVVVSGLHASVGLWGEATAEETRAALGSLSTVGLQDRAEGRFGDLSYGQQRRVLIARAMVKTPLLLLLDEPMDGLDSETRKWLHRYLNFFVRCGTQYIFVTHHMDDIPASATHCLDILTGRSVIGKQPRRCHT